MQNKNFLIEYVLRQNGISSLKTDVVDNVNSEEQAIEILKTRIKLSPMSSATVDIIRTYVMVRQWSFSMIGTVE